MGIEPTNRTVYVRLNGFEDRGHHQVYKHFHRDTSLAGVRLLSTAQPTSPAANENNSKAVNELDVQPSSNQERSPEKPSRRELSLPPLLSGAAGRFPILSG